MPKCWRYDPIDPEKNENCGNCKRWNGAKVRCRDHALLKKRLYEESPKYRTFDRMMRDNKGVRLD